MYTLTLLLNRVLSIVPFSWRGRIKNIPLVGWAQRAVTAAVLNGQEFVHESDAGPARGVRFVVQLPEDKGIWTGTYEAEFAAGVGKAVRPGMVCYDIGGWHGFFAGIMAAQGAREVHVFEPLPANAERIARLAELNPQFSFKLHRCALGHQVGHVDLCILPQSSMAKIAESLFQPEAFSTERLSVPMATLDSIVSEGNAPPPEFVKIDVEGAELLVLRGAHETLRRHRPIVFAEIHSAALFAECSRLLSDLGYTIELIGPSGPSDGSDAPVHIRATAQPR